MDVSAQQRVVAVGASAGGVKALIRLAAALPSFAPKSLPVNDIDSTDVVLKLTTADESGRYRCRNALSWPQTNQHGRPGVTEGPGESARGRERPAFRNTPRLVLVRCQVVFGATHRPVTA